MPDSNMNTPARPGYSPATATLKPLHRHASGQLSRGDKVTVRRLEDDGVSASDAYEVRIAWKHLGLVDAEYCVTEKYERLIHATDNEFKILLGKILKTAYSDVFNRLAERSIALDNVDQQELRSIFRDCHYEPVDMQSKMITLFRGLCREAVFELGQEPGQKFTEAQHYRADGDKAPDPLSGFAPMTEPASTLDFKGLSPKQVDSIETYMYDTYRYALEVLWSQRKSPDWTEADRLSWQKAMAANVNLLQTLLEGLLEEKN